MIDKQFFIKLLLIYIVVRIILYMYIISLRQQYEKFSDIHLYTDELNFYKSLSFNDQQKYLQLSNKEKNNFTKKK